MSTESNDSGSKKDENEEKDGNDDEENEEEEEEEESIIAHLNLSEEQLAEYAEAFAVFDKEGEGVITSKILSNTMMTLGQNLTEAEIQDMIKDVDVDGNGEVDFEEFVLMLHRRMTQEFDPKEEIKDVFNVLDRDGNGLISKAEMKHVITQVGIQISDDEMTSLMNVMDSDFDGHVCMDEFINFVKDYNM